MYQDDITVFAETTFRNRRQKFGIKEDDRRRHMYLIGKTGMGKSTVMENMIVYDIRAGKGVAVVDPHGDLAEKVMQYIPEERIKDVVYFNPADMDFPIAFNIVEQVDVRVRHLVASGLVGVFKKLWADSWGPRLEYILRNAILAILDYPDSTLLGVVRMLSDKSFRKKVMASVQDPVVRAFWEKEFAGYADKFASEAVSPIQNKVGQFLSSALIRNIVGQKRSAIDMREVMDSGKILILNLSKGHIGEDNSALLGAMMITKIQLAAMSRVNIPESERKDFYLYIDEFQNFSTESFATILSEARKYHLDLIMAHQYMEQLSEDVRAAVFGNVGTMVCFRVGATDAEELVKEFSPTFMQEDILNIPKYEFYLKLMIDGVASEPFSARGLMPLSKDEITGNFDKCVEYTRQYYAKDRKTVEDDIMRTHFVEDDPNKKQQVKQPSKNSPQQIRAKDDFRAQKKNDNFQKKEGKQPAGEKDRPAASRNTNGNEVNCSVCGKKTIVNFIPDGVRPIYCRDCRSELKKKKREGGISGNNFLADISPSQLEKINQGQEDKEKKDSDWISLSDLKGRDVARKFSAGPNEKESPQTNGKEPGKHDLEEDEDIIFD
ncbi:type IV secretion system DNA-binding domain-containing protein [Candidatus Falkowbacteria bacterium]|nr:type IV secretion system DNA-binding domain-containing protein [Candidatus Falkowbacteria bacterium]